jgi:hypothetical protein
MESILWACNLLALVYLCFWAIRQDKAQQAQRPQSKPKSKFGSRLRNNAAEKAPEFSPASLQE